MKHPFERILAVYAADINLTLEPLGVIPWADFLLNPRRLRGSDFLMRWSQGIWSEELLTQAVNATAMFFALPYGPSGTAPDNDVRAFELYFERLEKAGLGKLKRPDLLVFRSADKARIQNTVEALGGLGELPFVSENDDNMKSLLEYAVVAVECENSLWRARQMPDYSTPFSPQRRLGGRLGLKRTAVLPTIIIKEEDREPLRSWQQTHQVPIAASDEQSISGMRSLTRLSVFLLKMLNCSSLAAILNLLYRCFRLLAEPPQRKPFTRYTTDMPILWLRQLKNPFWRQTQ